MLLISALRRWKPKVALLIGTAGSVLAPLALDDAECKRAAGDPYAEADALFASNEYAKLAAQLRTALAGSAEDQGLLWRMGRACKKLADSEPPKSVAKRALISEGIACTERSLSLQEGCGPCHKWHAILLTETGQFEGTSATIKNSFVVREHFERAVDLSPADATSRHLLGLWCFEVAKLSWLEQKAAAAFFATPPQATFAEAATHFEVRGQSLCA